MEEEKKNTPEWMAKEAKAKRIRRSKLIKFIFINIMWFISGVVLAYFCYLIITQFLHSMHVPGNTLTYVQNATLLWPTATICNWNQNIEGDPSLAPEYTNLTLMQCVDWASNGGSGGPCANDTFTFQYINTAFGIFNCFVFNNNSNNVSSSMTTGFAGSISALFSITAPPANYDFRSGLQVTFDYIGNPPDLYNEIRFAPPGYDAFFGIQTTEITFLNNQTGPFYSYSTSYSSTQLPNYFTFPLPWPQNDTELVSVSFSFQTLNMQVIEYDTAYTVINLFGDFSGMIGVLMGMDIIKLTVSLPVCFAVCGEGEFAEVTEHFSG